MYEPDVLAFHEPVTSAAARMLVPAKVKPSERTVKGVDLRLRSKQDGRLGAHDFDKIPDGQVMAVNVNHLPSSSVWRTHNLRDGRFQKESDDLDEC